MRQHPIASAKRVEGVQPTAVLGTIGMITLLMLMWAALVV
jgi:hypothetical protein